MSESAAWRVIAALAACVLVSQVAFAEADGASDTASDAPTGWRPRGYPASRIEVDTRVHPWKAIGRINVAGQGYCTGTLVGDRVVVTAAHCLWNPRTRSFFPNEYIHFVAGYQREQYPAHSTAKRVIASKRFVGGLAPSPERFPVDWAIVELEQPLGAKAGWLGWARFDGDVLRRLGAARQAFSQAGYRRDRRYVLSVNDDCRLERFVEAGRLIVHRCATLEGDSGGPLLIADGDDWLLVGINVGLHRSAPRSIDRSYAVPSANFVAALREVGIGGEALEGERHLWGRRARTR